LLGTAALMGLAGGPHCVAMCGCLFTAAAPRPVTVVRNVRNMRIARFAVNGQGTAAPGPAHSQPWALQFGRLTGYAMLGLVAGASGALLRELASASAALKPLWAMTLVAAALLGATLLLRARQPLWLEQASRGASASLGRLGQRIAHRGRSRIGLPPSARSFMLGTAWAALPCGLLYSALLVSSLANNPASAALAMAAFGAASGVSLQVWSWLWARMRRRGDTRRSPRDWQGKAGTRLAGAALMAFAVWGLLHGWVPQLPQWCAAHIGL
jgi:hypothetical protein